MEKDNLSAVEQYDAVMSRREDIDIALQNGIVVDDEVRQMYEDAAKKLDQEIILLRTNKHLVDDVEEMRNRALKGLDQLSAIEDLVDPVKLETKRGDLQLQIAKAAAFLTENEIGIDYIDVTADTIGNKPSDQAIANFIETEASAEIPEAIEVTLHRDFLQIGKRGKIVQFESRYGDATQISSTQIRNALTFLAKNYLVPLKPNEIWSAIAGNGARLSSAEKNRFKNFFDSLTFRRQPIVLFNGKRGLGSRHTLQLPINITFDSSNTPIEEIISADNEANNHPPAITEVDLENNPTLSVRGAATIAAFINMHSEALEANGIPTINSGVVDELLSADPSVIGESFDNELIVERRQAFDAFRRLLQSESAFFEAVDSIATDDIRYKVIEYLFELDGEEQWALLDRLVEARVDTFTTLSLRRAGTSIVSHDVEITDNLGKLITPVRQSSSQHSQRISPTASPKAYDTAHVSAARDSAKITTSTIVLDEPMPKPKQAEKSVDLPHLEVQGIEIEPDQQAQQLEIKSLINTILLEMLDFGLPLDGTHKLVQINRAIPSFNPRTVEIARARGVIPKNSNIFTTFEIIQILANKTLGNKLTKKEIKGLYELLGHQIDLIGKKQSASRVS